MKYKFLFILICLCSLLCSHCIALASALTYADIDETEWYAESVQIVTKQGIMTGTGGNYFSPQKTVSIEEGIVLIARIAATQNKEKFYTEDDWFTPAYRYLLNSQIIAQEEYAPNTILSREFFITLLIRVASNLNLVAINSITFLPDYDSSSDLGKAILTFYNAGILTGTNSQGNFSKDQLISRAEMAVIISRYLEPTARVTFSLHPPDGLKTISVPINTDALIGKELDFNGYYLISKDKITGNCFVYNMLGEIFTGKNVLLSYSGDRDIYRIAENSFDTTSITYYINGTKLKNRSFYRGSEFCEGIALVQPDNTPSYQTIDRSGNTIFSFTLTEEIPVFPSVINSGWIQLNKYKPYMNYKYAVLLNYYNGSLVELPNVMHFYGFESDGTALICRDTSQGLCLQQIDITLCPIKEINPYREIITPLTSSALTGYHLYLGDFIPEKNQSNVGILNPNYQVIVPPEQKLLFLNSHGKTLFVEGNQLYTLDIFSGNKYAIYQDNYIRAEFLTYNDTFIWRMKNPDGAAVLYDYTGNYVTPVCDWVILSDSAAIYKVNDRIFRIGCT